MDDTGRSAKIRVGGSGDGSWVVMPRAWWLLCHADARPDESKLQVREDRANLVISREVIILGSYVHSAENSVIWCVFLQYELEGFMEGIYEMLFCCFQWVACRRIIRGCITSGIQLRTMVLFTTLTRRNKGRGTSSTDTCKQRELRTKSAAIRCYRICVNKYCVK